MSSPRSPSSDLDQLLAQAGWIRRLAGQLAGDAQGSDDLAQDTWVRILSHPPAGGRPLRGWIATVMRNLLRHQRRTAVRRAAREQLHARAAQDDTAALLDEVAVQREVVEAVVALDEPYRTTILLRYFEDMTPKRIADRQRIPVSTVKTRLARGLVRLRRRLAHDESGRGALAALVPLAWRPPKNPLLPLLGALMANLKPVVVAVVAIAGLSFAFTYLGDSGSPRPAAREPAPAEPSAGGRAEVAGGDAGGSAGPRVEVAASPAAPAGARAAKAPLPFVEGLVLDVAARPVAGVAVRTDPPAGAAVAAESTSGVAETDGEGRFRLTVRGVGRLVVDDARFVTVLAGQPVPATSGKRTIVVVAPRIALGGQVVDAAGNGLGGASVELAMPDDLRARLGAVLDFSVDRHWQGATGPAGQFSFDDAPAVEGARLHVRLEGYRPDDRPAPRVARRDLLVTLRRPAPERRTLAGIVVDPGGAPVEGARVAMGIDTTLTDSSGRFLFALDAEQTFNHLVSRFLEVDTGKLIAVKPGYLPGELVAPSRDATGRPSWPDPIVLRLGGEPLSIGGVVVDDDGEPLAGRRVWIADPTFFGGLGDPSSGSMPHLTHMENLLAGAKPGWSWTETDAEGRFHIGGLLARRYKVQAMETDTLLRSEVAEVAAGRGDVRIVLSARDCWDTLRGRVIDRRGEPIAGASVFPMCDAFATRVQGRTASTQHMTAGAVRTDAQGRFELRHVPRDLVYLRLESPGTIPLEWGRHVEGGLRRLVGEDYDHLEITLGRRCSFQVVLADPDEADQLAVLDADGRPLEISEFRGNGRREGRRQRIRDGRSSQLGVADSATTLVLYRGEQEVRRVPLALSPERRTVVQQ